MDYNYLGTSGIKLSSIGLGTQTFGWNIFGAEAHELLDIYTDAGGNCIDTADSYNEGQSEIILGDWLKKRKKNDDLIIGTKSYFPVGDGPNEMGNSRRNIVSAVEQSLKRLGTDAIDLFQLHCFDGRVALEEMLLTLDDLVKAGKIRYFGLSNYTPSSVMKAVMIQRHASRYQISSLQLEYSLLVRGAEWELLPLCMQEGIGAIIWSPLAGGWLTGKYKRGRDAPENSRVGRQDRWDDLAEQRGGERTWKILDVLDNIASDHAAPVSQAALNWLLKKNSVTTVLVGARTPEQLKNNLGCMQWKLSDGEEAILDDVSGVEPPSPYNFISRYTRK